MENGAVKEAISSTDPTNERQRLLLLDDGRFVHRRYEHCDPVRMLLRLGYNSDAQNYLVTTNDKNKRLAELLGKEPQWWECPRHSEIATEDLKAGCCPWCGSECELVGPDYCHDLNAVHAVGLSTVACRQYWANLIEATGRFGAIDATGEQRVDALIATLEDCNPLFK